MGQRRVVARAERVAAASYGAPSMLPVNPDANVYGVALLLSLASGFLFGAVPVRQVLHTDPYQVIKSGSTATAGRRITVRDLLLVVQIAICAVLVTSSMVAVRGLVRSLHSNFGFEPQNAMLVETDLSMAGYSGDTSARNAKAHDRRCGDHSRRKVRGIGRSATVVLRREQHRCLYRQNDRSAAIERRCRSRAVQHISRILRCGPDDLVGGQDSHLARRQKCAARSRGQSGVCQQNLWLRNQRDRRILQEARWNAHTSGGHCRRRKIWEPRRRSAAGDVSPHPAIAFELRPCLVVRSNGDPQQLAAAIKNTVRDLDAGLPFTIQTWNQELESALFPSRMATVSLGVLGVMGAMLSITGIFGMAAYSVSKRLRELGIRMALGAQRKEVLQAALGRAFKLLAFGSAAGLLLGILASRVLAFIVYQATPRDPLVLAGVVLAMMLLGLLATWIPAQRALSVDPTILLREE